MKHQPTFIERKAAMPARPRTRRAGKRRIARDIVERGLRQRQALARTVLSGGAAVAIGSAAMLFEFAL